MKVGLVRDGAAMHGVASALDARCFAGIDLVSVDLPKALLLSPWERCAGKDSAAYLDALALGSTDFASCDLFHLASPRTLYWKPPGQYVYECDMAFSHYIQAYAPWADEIRELRAEQAAELRAIESTVVCDERCLGVITWSEWARAYICDEFGVDQARVRVIRPSVQQKQRRVAHGKRRHLLFVGRWHQRKGGDVCIAAFRQVLVDEPDAVLTYVGGLDMTSTVEDLIDSGKLRWVPAVQDRFAVGRLMNEADVFILPTRMESFGMVLLEALAWNLPIVTTDGPWLEDLVRNGLDGFVVASDDAEAVAHRATILLHSDSEYVRILEMQRNNEHLRVDYALTRYPAGKCRRQLCEAQAPSL